MVFIEALQFINIFFVFQMCCKQMEKDKYIAAPFFPPGWKFFFSGEEGVSLKTSSSTIFKKNKGLVLISPNRKRFGSADGAMKTLKSSLKFFSFLDKAARRDSFNRYIGLCNIPSENSNVISTKTVGSRCYARWMDFNWFPVRTAIDYSNRIRTTVVPGSVNKQLIALVSQMVMYHCRPTAIANTREQLKRYLGKVLMLFFL